MSWFKRKPKVHWYFLPKHDITAFELARCVILLNARLSDIDVGELADAAGEEVMRHWEKKER